MSGYVCPVCRKSLIEDEKCFKCENGHNFDKARSGYVNLLPNNLPSGKNHGDNKLMIKARKDFLEKGYYRCLSKKIEEIFNNIDLNGKTVLDAGCGECWYTDNIYKNLPENNLPKKFLAVDISKDALNTGAKRNKNISCAAASVFNLPLADKGCDVLFTAFAPFCREEYLRVLSDDGLLIMVIPSENHLMGLKKLIYDNPYKNEVKDYKIGGFDFLKKEECKSNIKIDNKNDIKNLFMMTPYYYKTGITDQKKVEKADFLETEIEFEILIYRKICTKSP